TFTTPSQKQTEPLAYQLHAGVDDAVIYLPSFTWKVVEAQRDRIAKHSTGLRAKPMAAESFSDSFIDEDPQKALEVLNEALLGDCDNAEWFCQRAYAHILLKNYSSAVDDAKKAQQLKPSLPLAFMRTGIGEYHLKNYESAHSAFVQGQQLDDSDKSFEVWIKRCEEMMGTAPPVKHDWYQTDSQVIVTVMAKNVPKDAVRVSFTEREVRKLTGTEADPSFQPSLRGVTAGHPRERLCLS
ncbi:hypothetical protein CCH79_00011365, partial [Gambusia affinis]